MSLQNRGIVKIAKGEAILTSIPIPKLRDDYILIQTISVALNPADWQTLDEDFVPGTTRSLLGIDAAGIVVEVGKSVTKSFKKGDRVAGFAHGGHPYDSERGSFAEYIAIKGDLAFRIPPNVSFEDAATLPCGIATVAIGFYRYLEIPMLTLPIQESGDNGQCILIYGGSSATGTLAIQFAKLSGFKVITTASPHNFDLLKSLGADHIFDYRDPECAQKIHTLTQNTLHKAMDTISTPSSAAICATALSTTGENICLDLMGTITFPRADVKSIFFLGYTALGEEFEFEGEVWRAEPGDFELARRVWGVVEGLWGEGRLRTHPVSVRRGVEGVIDGMQELKEKRASGVKLVYRIGEVEG